ncbi:MAG: hypothetical protein KatS3mg077_1325 [Candidatus Binatia bacterium]|nr:MAG: hypothetical protein KatS3mg077_1322 [Candidatus Binatia bacterium]GIW44043.1 MAG: hypothetical protein KatS3mg077_1325 [Candidatus Binatia bacterium]
MPDSLGIGRLRERQGRDVAPRGLLAARGLGPQRAGPDALAPPNIIAFTFTDKAATEL